MQIELDICKFLSSQYRVSQLSNIDKIIKDLKNRKVFRSIAIYAAFAFALEGKYNYKLFHQNGSMIEDGMFLPKFVALPIILFFLMIVVLFILFNVLF